jgi:hypothetical protein
MAKVFQPDEHLNRARRSFKSAEEASQFIHKKRLTKEAISLAAATSQAALAGDSSSSPHTTATDGSSPRLPSRSLLTMGSHHTIPPPRPPATPPPPLSVGGIPPGNMRSVMSTMTPMSPTSAAASIAAASSSPSSFASGGGAMSPTGTIRRLPPKLPTSHQLNQNLTQQPPTVPGYLPTTNLTTSPSTMPTLPASVLAPSTTTSNIPGGLTIHAGTGNGTIGRAKPTPPPLPTSPSARNLLLNAFAPTPPTGTPPMGAAAATTTTTTPSTVAAKTTTTTTTPTSPTTGATNAAPAPRPSTIGAGHRGTITSTLPTGLVVVVAPPAPPPPRAVVTLATATVAPVPTTNITVDAPPEAIPALPSTDINDDPLLSPRAANRPAPPAQFIAATEVQNTLPQGESFTVHSMDLSDHSSSTPPSSAPVTVKASTPTAASVTTLTKLMKYGAQLPDEIM